MEGSRKEKQGAPPRNEPYIQPVNGIVQPPVIPPPNRPGRRTNVLEDLKTVLNYIWRSRWSYHFRNPVDAINLGVPDYHTIVKRPMDLNTIKKRLQNNYYWEAEEALQDFDLVFDNCMHYNMEGTPVYQAGKELKNAFYNRLATIDLSIEEELKPKLDKRKRKAVEDLFSSPAPAPPPLPASAPMSMPMSVSTPPPMQNVMQPMVPPFPFPQALRVGPSLIPHAMPPLSSLMPNVTPSFMPDTLINPLNSYMQFSNISSMTLVKERQEIRPRITKSPPILNPLCGLPPSLTRGPVHMPPSPPTPSTPPITEYAQPTAPPVPDEPRKSPTPPPPEILPPIICYKELDRLIEKSHAVYLIKTMVKRKRRQFTWAFNRADYWPRYSQTPDYDHDQEELLDWRVLEERLSSDQFENIDNFVFSVRKMFQNALRCFPDDNLVKVSVKKSNEIFERRLPKCRDLIAKAKEHARSVVEAKEKKLQEEKQSKSIKSPIAESPKLQSPMDIPELPETSARIRHSLSSAIHNRLESIDDNRKKMNR